MRIAHLPMLLLAAIGLAAGSVVRAAPAPALDCRQADNSIQKMVCNDRQLSALDRQLAAVVAAAEAREPDGVATMRAEEQAWIERRDSCWKQRQARRCTEAAYRLRIAEIQARHGLVPTRGPFVFECANGREAISVIHLQTQPPSMLAQRGPQTVLMTPRRAASGARYEAKGYMLWEHQGEAAVRWGRRAAEERCVLR